MSSAEGGFLQGQKVKYPASHLVWERSGAQGKQREIKRWGAANTNVSFEEIQITGVGQIRANKKYRRVSSRVSASFSAAAQFNNFVIEHIFQRFQLAFKMPFPGHYLLVSFISNSILYVSKIIYTHLTRFFKGFSDFQ